MLVDCSKILFHSHFLFICVLMGRNSVLLEKCNSIKYYASGDNPCFLEVMIGMLVISLNVCSPVWLLISTSNHCNSVYVLMCRNYLPSSAYNGATAGNKLARNCLSSVVSSGSHFFNSLSTTVSWYWQRILDPLL